LLLEVNKSSGANPTIESYNAKVVEICNAMGSLVRFENKIFYYTLKNALPYYIQRWSCCCKFGSRRIDWLEILIETLTRGRSIPKRLKIEAKTFFKF
jgi:hypothetical protein